MKENNILNIINSALTDNSYIGDDCAYIEDLDIFVTHDTLVQDVHFTLETTTPFLLGRKAIAVNLSDLAAALSEPKFITISISLPYFIKESFIKEFYEGVNSICNEYNVKVIGGDITGSPKKIVISVSAIGKRNSLYLSSRKFAQKDNIIVTTGSYGLSACGLYAIQNYLYATEKIMSAHRNPIPKIKEGLILGNIINSNIVVTDTSDGLVDALYKISKASKHNICLNSEQIPIDKDVYKFAERNELNALNLALYGGEDFELVSCIPEETYKLLDNKIFKPIGKILNKDNNPTVTIKNSENDIIITDEIFNQNTFNHFKEE